MDQRCVLNLLTISHKYAQKYCVAVILHSLILYGMSGVRWSCKPNVSHAVLDHVMASLVSAGVLKETQIKDAAELVSEVTANE